MTNYTNEQIYNAVKLIKDICTDNVYCQTCPFYNHSNCQIIESGEPHQWNLIAPTEQYKAFK